LYAAARQLLSPLNPLGKWIYIPCMQHVVPELEIISDRLKYSKSVYFSSLWALERRLNIYGNFVWIRRNSVYMVTNLRSGRAWFVSRKRETELSLAQSVLYGCHTISRI
jgi:hypothetical protein